MHSLPANAHNVWGFVFFSIASSNILYVERIVDILGVCMQCMDSEHGRNHMAFFSLRLCLSILCSCRQHRMLGARHDSYSWCTYHVHKWYQIVYRCSNGFRYFSIFLFFLSETAEKKSGKSFGTKLSSLLILILTVYLSEMLKCVYQISAMQFEHFLFRKLKDETTYDQISLHWNIQL